MKLPEGRLVRRRVVTDLGTPLETVLDEELTGYARLESQDALLLDADGVGVLTFESGIPMAAYHTGTDNGGEDAMADLAVAGPYRLELYELGADILQEVHAAEDLLVPPGLPADRLAGDPELYERTRDAAPEHRLTSDTEVGASLDAVESFLEDAESIRSLRERARKEAHSRADEWGLAVPEE